MENKPIKAGETFELHETGMILKDMPYGEWCKQGKNFTQVIAVYTRYLPWWLGDWIIYGENKFPEMYSQALEACHYSYGTLRNCVYVARNVPMQNRTPTLTFGHHVEVAPLTEEQQREWLAKADTNKWTINELKAALAAAGLKKVDHPPARRFSFGEWYDNHKHEVDAIQDEVEMLRWVWEQAVWHGKA